MTRKAKSREDFEDQVASMENFGEVVKSLQKLKNDRRMIDAHEVREIFGPFGDNLDKDSPEHAIMEFLSSWKGRNYGRMAERSVNLSGQSIKKIAGQLRRDAELIELRGFELRSVRQSTVSRTDAVAFLKGMTVTGEVDGEYRIVAFKYAENGEIAMPADSGSWRVQEACMFDLLHRRTIDEKSN